MIGIDCFVMKVPNGRSTSTTAAEVSQDARVSWAEPVSLYTARASPAAHNDALYPAEPAASEWHLADLHRMSSGRGTRTGSVQRSRPLQFRA